MLAWLLVELKGFSLGQGDIANKLAFFSSPLFHTLICKEQKDKNSFVSEHILLFPVTILQKYFVVIILRSFFCCILMRKHNS